MGGSRYDDLTAGTALAFGAPGRVLVAHTPDEVVPVLAEVDRATRDGAWAYGCVSYDAAPGLDPSLAVAGRRPDDPPLAWFGLTGPPGRVPPVASGSGAATTGPWLPDRDGPRFRDDVERLRGHIAAGDVYQANLTRTLSASFRGDPAGLYADLALNQRGPYAALLDLGRHVVASASPELFFRWSGDALLTRPMKGTALRGRTPAEDRARVDALVASAKERAENVMVVDLLRNDLGRVAEVGSVRVPALWVPERYDTVWQLTSDVIGTVPPATPLVDVFRALFPSGSVTGAPKHRAMQLIRELEGTARGLYCGAVGWVAPPGEPVRAQFSVAIRTAVVDRETGRASYGTGAGITWASDPQAELDEVTAKAAILGEPFRDVALLETMAYEPGAGVRELDRHLRRLTASAGHLGFACDDVRVRAAVDTAVRGCGPSRVRLALARDGSVRVEVGPLPRPPDGPVTLAVDPVPVDSTSRWLHHKTTRRDAYEVRSRRHPEADDVVLVNERGEVTETTIAHLAVLLDGTWWTPPLSSGCLPGVGREVLVEGGRLRERTLTVADLERADGLALVSAVRGWRPAVLLRARVADRTG